MKMKKTVGILLLLLVSFQLPGQILYNKPIDPEKWLDYRKDIKHPAGLYTAEDIAQARNKVKTDPEAAKYAKNRKAQAYKMLEKLTPEFLEDFISRTSPMGVYGPCPACRAKGLPWHPNGTWEWTEQNPDQIKCTSCNTVFPNEDFTEDVIFTSTWDPEQTFSYIGGEAFPMYGTTSRPSISGMLRTRKLMNIISHMNNMSIAYMITGDVKIAEGVKKILIRLADVLPNYLYGCAIYNELADCDPHVASKAPYHLPTFEISPPPRMPNKSMHAGYWQGFRLGSSGGDGGLATLIASSYDVTCDAVYEDGTPLYTEEDKIYIEKNALLEVSYHLISDEGINNKSVSNRAGAAMIGKVCGQPDMVRFGLDGFQKTINSWFLPDGSTSESASYGLMTMNGIRNFAYMFRDYTEPTSYTPPENSQPLVNFNICKDTLYSTCWQNLILMLQGNMQFPPTADSHRGQTISSYQRDTLAQCCPTQFNLAFCTQDGNKKIKNSDLAIYYGADIPYDGENDFILPDVVFPYLSQGYLRTGAKGMDSAAILNASDWGNHHHNDSLNLTLWHADELLSDLGYLWDHPQAKKSRRALAHNLVVIDGKEQVSQKRGGSFTLFSAPADGNVKAMTAQSDAYGNDRIYKRTVLQISHGDKGFYWVDLFMADKTRFNDYVFHGPNNSYTISGATLTDADAPAIKGNQFKYKMLEKSEDSTCWQISWNIKDGHNFTAFLPFTKNEQLLFANEWGQRDYKNSDVGATLPYFCRRRTGTDIDRFAAVFYSDRSGSHLVQNVTAVETNIGLAMTVETPEGKDIIMFAGNGNFMTYGDLKTDADIAVIIEKADSVEGEMINGTSLKYKNTLIANMGPVSCNIKAVVNTPGESYFDLTDISMFGKTLHVVGDDDLVHAYPILKTEQHDGFIRVFTMIDNYGFPANGGSSAYVNLRGTFKIQQTDK